MDKEKIFRKAKNNRLPVIKRVYDYHNSIFIALLISILLYFFDFVKTLALEKITFGVFILNLFIFLAIGLLWVASNYSRNGWGFAIRIREEGKHKSKKAAFKLIDELTRIRE